MASQDNESGNDGGSEASLSSDISDCTSEKKPCQICGSDANEESIATCVACNVTREHIYCMRVVLRGVPHMWLCESCRIGVGIVHVGPNQPANQNSTSNESSSQLSSPVVEDAASPMSIDTSPGSSDSNMLPSDTSPGSSDSNMLPSDSESKI